MTREEEIEKYAAFVGLKVRDSAVLNGIDRPAAEIISVIAEMSAVDGAKWADEHPREQLVDINKVKIWIADFFDKYYIEDRAEGIEVSDDFILKSFLKAMEE